MGIVTKVLKLLKPEPNDYYNEKTEQSDNWDKVEVWAEKIEGRTGFATKTKAGIVEIGDNLTIGPDGKLSGNKEYTHPSTAGNKHIPSGGSSGQFLGYKANGEAQWADIELDDYLKTGTLPAKVPNAQVMLELLRNNSGLDIDWAILYIQNNGTKIKNKYYFDKNQPGLFRAMENTTTIVNDSRYFTDDSNYSNAAKLEGLAEYAMYSFSSNERQELFNFQAITETVNHIELKVKKEGYYTILASGWSKSYEMFEVFVNSVEVSTSQGTQGDYPVSLNTLVYLEVDDILKITNSYTKELSTSYTIFQIK